MYEQKIPVEKKIIDKQPNTDVWKYGKQWRRLVVYVNKNEKTCSRPRVCWLIRGWEQKLFESKMERKL